MLKRFVRPARSRGPLRAPAVLVSTTQVKGGTGAKLGWLGLVEFDVDRPRSRATDGHSVNATRKTENPAFIRHKSGFVLSDEGKIYDGRAPRVWARHAPPLAVAARASFLVLGAERPITSQGHYLCRSALATREMKIK